MPANIAKDSFGYLSVYADTPPWHPEVGALVKGAMTAEQVVKRSRQNGGKGLGFVVETVPAFVAIGRKHVEAPGFRGIIRTDTRDVYGFVSDEYVPIQNIDALRLPEAIAATKQAGFISAGALGNGARLFATMDLSRLTDLKIPGDPSKHKALLSATWSHDGTEALRIGFSRLRIECANMRRMQLASWDKGAELNVRIIHTGNVADQTDEAARVLGFAEQVITADTLLLSVLADIAIPRPGQKWIAGFTERLVPIPETMERTRGREEAREAIAHLINASQTLRGVKPTMYRVLQAVDEYVDHDRPMRTSDPLVAGQRAMRNVLGEGPGADMKALAMRLIREEFEVHELAVAKVAASN